jgi:hypothetical protein
MIQKRTTENHLIPLMPIEDMDVWASKMIDPFGGQKREWSVLSARRF